VNEQLQFTWNDPVTPRAEPEPLQHQAEALHAYLVHRAGVALQLRITNNVSTLISLRPAPGGVMKLSLHHMFLDAPPEVRKALAAWVRRPRARKPGDVLDDFIRAQAHLVQRPTKPRQQRLITQGKHHDLQALFDRVNAEEFGGAMTAAITWGRMPPPRKRRSIRFGSYSPAENLIRMHPLLDQEFVPRFFVEYIVFHEMLHEFFGIEETASGRRSIHPKVFRDRERHYKLYDLATAWLKQPQNLRKLLHISRPRRVLPES
jgi:hypothetical protein